MTTRSRKPRIRVTRLELENWKNFSRATMDLSMRAFLVGPNASGKSNLLDALRFLKDLARQGGGLQEAVATRGGMSAIRSLAARRAPAVRMLVQLGDDEAPAQWSYEVAFNHDKELKRPALEMEVVRCGEREILRRPTNDDRADPTLLTQTHLEQISANQEFREVGGFLASIQYRHIVPQIVREPERWRSHQFDPFGGDFLQVVADTPKNVREARLRRIAKALKIAAPQLGDLELVQEKGTPHIPESTAKGRAVGFSIAGRGRRGHGWCLGCSCELKDSEGMRICRRNGCRGQSSARVPCTAVDL